MTCTWTVASAKCKGVQYKGVYSKQTSIKICKPPGLCTPFYHCLCTVNLKILAIFAKFKGQYNLYTSKQQKSWK